MELAPCSRRIATFLREHVDVARVVALFAQEAARGHDTETRKFLLSIWVDRPQVQPSYMNASPPQRTGAQKLAFGHLGGSPEAWRCSHRGPFSTYRSPRVLRRNSACPPPKLWPRSSTRKLKSKPGLAGEDASWDRADDWGRRYPAPAVVVPTATCQTSAPCCADRHAQAPVASRTARVPALRWVGFRVTAAQRRRLVRCGLLVNAFVLNFSALFASPNGRTGRPVAATGALGDVRGQSRLR